MEKEIQPGAIYSLNEASRAIPFISSYITVRRYAERGELITTKRAGRYFIKGSDLINFIKKYEKEYRQR